jgi:hypothetical protein
LRRDLALWPEAPLRRDAVELMPDGADDRCVQCESKSRPLVPEIRDPSDCRENSESRLKVLARLLASLSRYAQLLGLPGCGGPSGVFRNQRAVSLSRALLRLVAREETLSVSGVSDPNSE